MIVLWIDPWTTTTWYAVVEKIDTKLNLIDYWVIETTPKIELKDKILEIIWDLNYILEKYDFDKVVVEKLFFTTNLKTWIDVAQARGAILYELWRKGLFIEEYTPLQLKKAITWNWKANKLQLQRSIKILLKLDEIPKPDDAADAIGLAYMWILKNNYFI